MGGGGTIQQISEILDAHYRGDIDISDYWAVGDNRTESISEIPSGTVGETQPTQDIELVIIGMNHDDLKTKIGDITKAAITVQVKNCLSTEGYMNSDYFSIGNALWSNSKRRTWCNNEFINALSTLKGLIKPVVKLSNRHTDSKYSSYRQQETTEDYVFLLSQWEVWGIQKFSSDYGTLPAEGFQYEYMETNNNRIKRVNTSPTDWWIRSSYTGSNENAHFAFVSDGGYYSAIATIASHSYGLAPAFCL